LASITTASLERHSTKVNGPVPDGLRPKSGAVLHHRRGRDDQPGRIGEVRQERRVGRVQREASPSSVDRGLVASIAEKKNDSGNGPVS
jgi:hypothetical protein